MRLSILYSFVIFFILGFVGGVAVGMYPKFFPVPEKNVESVVVLPSPSISREEEILRTFTTGQKIALLLAMPLTLKNTGDIQTMDDSSLLKIESVAEIQPGFVVVYGSALSMSTMQMVTPIIRMQMNMLPLTIAVDHEGGVVQRLKGKGFTVLPSWQTLCNKTMDEMRDVLATSADELRQAGVDMVFGPVLDLLVEPPNAVLGARTCALTVEEVEKRVSSAVEIYEDEAITPVLKHYPGIGEVRVDLHKAPAEVNLSEEQVGMYTRVLRAYPHIGVMASHVGIAGGEAGVPCTLSSTCAGTLASAFPTSLTVTDGLGMTSALGYEANPERLQTLLARARLAILVGNDVLILDTETTQEQLNTLIADLTKGYEKDPAFAAAVDRAAQRVVQWKLQKYRL